MSDRDFPEHDPDGPLHPSRSGDLAHIMPEHPNDLRPIKVVISFGGGEASDITYGTEVWVDPANKVKAQLKIRDVTDILIKALPLAQLKSLNAELEGDDDFDEDEEEEERSRGKKKRKKQRPPKRTPQGLEGEGETAPQRGDDLRPGGSERGPEAQEDSR